MDVREKLSSEKRLIDANKLIDFIDVGHLRNPGELCYSEVDVANLLLHAPTVDAVEVVRCRECKQGEVDDPDFLDEYYCHAGCGWNNGDFYCSYGERKEGSDNG